MKRFSDHNIITANGLNAGGEPPIDSQVKLCEIWIKMFLIETKSINTPLGSSYRLKHLVEEFGRALQNYNIKLKGIDNLTYISNGAFIQAMKNCGYLYSDTDSTLNPYFNAAYNGPFIIQHALRNIPTRASEWEKILSPLLSSIVLDSCTEGDKDQDK